MKAVLALFHGLFNGLFTIPLFDTGVTIGHFVMAIVVLDVGLIVMKHVFRKDSPSNGGSHNGGNIKK